jgi:hypothetical protein
MKLIFFILFGLPWLKGATISDQQKTLDFHECLVDYMKTQNISTESVSVRSSSEISGCQKLHIKIQGLMDEILEDVTRNIEKVLTNQTEAECFVGVLRSRKFIEHIIVLPAAQMTNQNEIPKLDGVYTRSKNIFLLAAMKCLISEDTFMDIFLDFSAKMNVNEHEFDCIKRKLHPTDEIETTTASDKSSKETMRKHSETEGNSILRNSLELSAESDMKVESCEEIYRRIEDKISHFEFPSLDKIENSCMSEKVNKNDIEAVLEFIIMKKMTKTPEEISESNEKMKSLITVYICNIIECTNILKGFTDFIDILLPLKSTKQI